MSKENLPAGLGDLASGLAQVQQFAQSAVEDIVTYVKMGKDGVWTYGTDEIEVEEGSEWAVNPMSFATGYSAFDAKGTRLGEEMRSMKEPPLKPSDLPTVGATWVPQIGFQVCCLNGEDKGLQGLINQRSRGGMQESAKLLAQVIERVDGGDENVVAIITLHNSSYKHPTYGKIFTPVYEVVRWTTMDETLDDANEAPEPEQAEEPPAPEPEPEPEQTEETPAPETETEPAKPVRRRRRRS